MTSLYYLKILNQLNPQTFDHFLQQLPQDRHYDILKYKKWEDQHRTLLGKILLIAALKTLGLTSYSLDNIKYTKFKKPYFDYLIDFNISHAGEYVVCAISKTSTVGIDVEEIKDIPLIEFQENFSKQEWLNICEDDDKLRAFYKQWTKKEAFLKAIGMGLNIPLNQISIYGDSIIWKSIKWNFYEINLDQNYVCHLSTNMHSQIQLQEFTIDQLLNRS